MIGIWRFRINVPEYSRKIARCDTGKRGEYKYVLSQSAQMEFFTDFNTND